MGFLALNYIGSFQTGRRIVTENPLEELWNRVARLGITAFTKTYVSSIGTPWDQWVPYAIPRFRQAAEFRRAASGGSLLTRPLSLYYSALNLMRAMYAMKVESAPAPRHGLVFKEAPSLLDCTATPACGTFADYLAANQVTNVTAAFTLRDCLACIPEVGDEFIALDVGYPTCLGLEVHALMNGEMKLEFHCQWDPTGFRDNWTTWFPSLATDCTLEPEGTLLRVNKGDNTKSYEAIAAFLASRLWPNLLWSEFRAIWYAPVTGTLPSLPRAAYYFLALFILGNVVRYTPEQLSDLTNPDSHLGWTMQRFVNAAERFYPQLMFHWNNERLYFAAQ